MSFRRLSRFSRAVAWLALSPLMTLCANPLPKAAADEGCPSEFGRCRKGDCDGSTPGTLGYWQVPMAGALAWTLLGSHVPDAGANDCCSKCRTTANCTFWQHLSSDSASPYAAGQCFLLSHDQPPTCLPSFLMDPASTPKTVAGGPCNPEVVDDPHFTDGYGVTFDFSGEDLREVYALVSDSHFHVNILLDGYRVKGHPGRMGGGMQEDLRTWIKEVGILWRAEGAQHSLHVTARHAQEETRGAKGYLGRAVLDGRDLALPLWRSQERADGKETVSSMAPLGFLDTKGRVQQTQGRMQLSDGLGSYNWARQMGMLSQSARGAVFEFKGVIRRGPFEVETYELSVPGLARVSLQLRPAHRLLQSAHDAQVHFNVGFLFLKTTPRVHGVLGQTFRRGREGRVKRFLSRVQRFLPTPRATFDALASGGSKDSQEGLLDGQPHHYKVSGVLEGDCLKCVFAS